MIKIIFYDNGFQVSGHSKPVTCGEVSAMTYTIIGTIFTIDKSASCYLEEGNTGYTALWFDSDNKIAEVIFGRFVEDFTKWCEECFEKNEFEIKKVLKWIEWEEIEKEVQRRGLSFDNQKKGE